LATVYDVGYAPQQGATVKAENGVSCVTLASGKCALSLGTGTWTITATKSGFQPAVQSIHLRADSCNDAIIGVESDFLLQPQK
jgi:hypothetical protein